MKKTLLITIIVLGCLAMAGLWIAGKYNTCVTYQENVENAWAQVETQYQRRADLIPNLVNTVKGYAAHEASTLEAVVAARAEATSTKIDASTLTEEQLANFQATEQSVSSALNHLLAVAEAYPDLKADKEFTRLMDELSGTENRVAAARNAFNEQAKQYNTAIRQFPMNIVAGMFGFEKKPYFEAEASAKTAPVVEF